jgi:hypothetical protein
MCVISGRKEVIQAALSLTVVSTKLKTGVM